MKKALIILLSVLAVLPFATPSFARQQEEREQFRPEVAEAIRLFQEEKVDEALAMLQQAIAADPNDAVAYNALGVVYSQMGDLEKALEQFDKAISLKEPYYKAIYNKFNLLIGGGRIDEAEALLKGVVERHPDHADGFINLGVLAGRRGNTESALDYFDRAIALNANDFDAYSKKGQLLVVEKRYDEALAAFNKAVEINPRFLAAKQAATYVQDIVDKKNQGYIRVRQIMVTDGEMAQRIKAELDKGADFAVLASRYSADASSKKFGGDLGFVKRGDLMKEIEDVIFQLEVGQVSGIVRSSRGFHLFKREE